MGLLSPHLASGRCTGQGSSRGRCHVGSAGKNTPRFPEGTTRQWPRSDPTSVRASAGCHRAEQGWLGQLAAARALHESGPNACISGQTWSALAGSTAAPRGAALRKHCDQQHRPTGTHRPAPLGLILQVFSCRRRSLGIVFSPPPTLFFSPPALWEQEHGVFGSSPDSSLGAPAPEPKLFYALHLTEANVNYQHWRKYQAVVLKSPLAASFPGLGQLHRRPTKVGLQFTFPFPPSRGSG